jgi:hypothetical protein
MFKFLGVRHENTGTDGDKLLLSVRLVLRLFLGGDRGTSSDMDGAGARELPMSIGNGDWRDCVVVRRLSILS